MSSAMDAHNTNYITVGKREVICNPESFANSPSNSSREYPRRSPHTSERKKKIPEQAEIYPYRGIKQVPISDFSNILESTVVLGLAKLPPNNRSHQTVRSSNVTGPRLQAI